MMADTLTVEEEVTRWKAELEAMKDSGNRVAKAKLKELDQISPSDATGLQNWVSSLFWLSRRNDLMAEAQAKVSKKDKVAEKSLAAEKEALEEVRAPKKFKTLEELLEFSKGVQAIRLDGRVPYDSLEVFWKGKDTTEDGELYLRVTPPKNPEVKHTVPPGEYRMLDVGIVTFCRRLGMSYTYFKKYPKKDEIVEHMNVLNRTLEKDFVLRLLEDGGTYVVQAVVAKGFVPIDNADILQALVQQEGEKPTLEAFIEGPFDRAIDVIDLRLPGTDKPLLRILNSEVDMSPLLFSVGTVKKDTAFVSMYRTRGAIRITHRGKAGDIRDWLKIPDLAAKAKPVLDALNDAWDKPAHKERTTEFLVQKVGLLGTDIQAFLQDYFVTHPGPDTVGMYSQALAEISRHQLSVSKLQKLADLSLALVYQDIPVVP